ncbi:metal-dependent phosphohydrolase [Streptomyces sp. NPDC057877]|uniref:metal-dependent phosphohydrolase n=1 Tax=Streptomyces sp. NPDC057877 TaxID=3346269 RepID=UPI0036AAB7AC
MELRSVEELMELLYVCDQHDHALRTAALLRRSRPADKELQVAGLVHAIGESLSADGTGRADLTADAVRPLLGERVARLVRLHVRAEGYLAALSPGHLRPAPGARGGAMSPAEVAAFARDPLADDALTLRQAHEAAMVPGLDAGVLEDWRTLLELVAARAVHHLPGA